MAVPAQRWRAETYDSDFDEDFTLGELSSGERICPPRAASDSLLPALLVIFIMLGGGWALLRYPPSWLPTELAALLAPASPIPPPPPPANTAPATEPWAVSPPPAQAEPPASIEIADAPGEGTKPASSPVTTGAIAPAAEQPAAYRCRHRRSTPATLTRSARSRSASTRIFRGRCWHGCRQPTIAMRGPPFRLRWQRPPTTPSSFGPGNASLSSHFSGFTSCPAPPQLVGGTS